MINIHFETKKRDQNLQNVSQAIATSPMLDDITKETNTEYLTNYFQISEKIFEGIKKRENIKAKLQAKNNRNEAIMQVDRDKLDEVTQILEEDIKMFKDKYDGMNIVWKGIYYEWFMNYEKWFYEMEIRNDLDYLN